MLLSELAEPPRGDEKVIRELWTEMTAATKMCSATPQLHVRVYEAAAAAALSWWGEESQPSHQAATSPPLALQMSHTDSEAGRRTSLRPLVLPCRTAPGIRRHRLKARNSGWKQLCTACGRPGQFAFMSNNWKFLCCDGTRNFNAKVWQF